MYQYDDKGYRVRKQSYENGSLVKTTYYVRDASGSLMSTYEQEVNQTVASQTEVPIYGSSRVGMYQAVDQRTEYYLTDHLGNTRAIINRERLADGGIDVSYFADYFAYGSLARSAGSKPRYGYQGSFAEDETEQTGYIEFMLRSFDPVIGRWLSPDPMRQYASPYLAMGNNPVNTVDPTGGFGGPPCTGDCDYDPTEDWSYHPEYEVTITAPRMVWLEEKAHDIWYWNPPGGVKFYNEYGANPSASGEQIGRDPEATNYVEVMNMPFLPAWGSANVPSRNGRGSGPSSTNTFSVAKEWMENFKFGLDAPGKLNIKPVLQPTAPSGTEGMEVHQEPIFIRQVEYEQGKYRPDTVDLDVAKENNYKAENSADFGKLSKRGLL